MLHTPPSGCGIPLRRNNDIICQFSFDEFPNNCRKILIRLRKLYFSFLVLQLPLTYCWKLIISPLLVLLVYILYYMTPYRCFECRWMVDMVSSGIDQHADPMRIIS